MYRSFAKLNGSRVLSYWLDSLEKEGDEATSLLRKVCNELIEQEELPEALKHLFGDGLDTRLSPFTDEELAQVRESHCAMVDRGQSGEVPVVFPLDGSQRLALHGFLKLEEGTGAIAVSGPPGTGKTDMLRAVMSTVWVQAALKGENCPIMVVCGATNQSVENVMHSFNGAVNCSGKISLSSRWIEGIDDYTASCPAKSKSDEHEACYQVVYPDKDGRFLYKGKVSWVEELSRNDIPDLAEQFISKMVCSFAPEALSAFPAVLTAIEGDLTELLDLHQAAEECKEYNSRNKEGNTADKSQARSLMKRSAAFLQKQLSSLVNIQQTNRKMLLQAFASGRPLREFAGDVHSLVSSFPVHPGIRLAEKYLLAAFGERDSKAFQEAVEGLIDVLFRPSCFHLAARYWEAEWIAALGFNLLLSPERSRIYHLRRVSMLFPCLVSTLHSVPRLFKINVKEKIVQDGKHKTAYKEQYLFGKADLLVVDEAGQAAPHIGGMALGLAHKVLVVGDLKQISPVAKVSPEEDSALVQQHCFQKQGQDEIWRKRGVTVTSGSVMQLVSTGASFAESGRNGILLRNHYRCVETIIGYCIELLYHDDDVAPNGQIIRRELQPQVKDLPVIAFEDTKHQGFPLHPMGFIQCGSVNDEPTLDTDTWVNLGEAQRIVDWLCEEGMQLVNWYEQVKSNPCDLAEVVAILTPFRGQKEMVQRLLKERLDPLDSLQQDKGKPLSERLVIGTVHTMQGAERDVILFSSVNKECRATSTRDSNADKVFLDRDGGNLLNVAVSRAKKSFILFGHADLFCSPQAMHESNDLPTAVLGRYMVRHGVKLHPKALVIVESPLKAKAIQEYLPDDFEVYGTGGHIRNLADLNLTPENNFEPTWKLESDEVRQNLQRTMSRLLQTPHLILATDPDPQGEAIAWHVLQVLKKHPWFRYIKTVSRVVFSSIEQQEIEAAFHTPRKTINVQDNIVPEEALYMGMVHAALTLRVLDGAIGSYYKRTHQMDMGRVRAALLRILARDFPTPEDSKSPYTWEMFLQVNIRKTKMIFPGYLIDPRSGENAPFLWSDQQVQRKIKESIEVPISASHDIREGSPEIKLVPPPDRFPPKGLGTAEVLGLAWEWFGFSPEYTTRLLQALYEHNPGGDIVQTTRPKRSDDLLVDLIHERVEIMARGWDLVDTLRRVEPELSDHSFSKDLEANLDQVALGIKEFDEVILTWSNKIFGSAFVEKPNFSCTQDDEGREAFPEGLPVPIERYQVGDDSLDRLLETIEGDKAHTSEASKFQATMGGKLAHPPISPLNVAETPDLLAERGSLSGDLLKLYSLIFNYPILSLLKPAILKLTPYYFPLSSGNVLVVHTGELIEPGWLNIHPAFEQAEMGQYVSPEIINNIANGTYVAAVSGHIRHRLLPHPTLRKVISLMQELGIGRPSTYATHLSKLFGS